MAEPQQIVQTQTTIDPAAKPEYAQFLSDFGAYFRPDQYTPYPGVQVPEFTPLQEQAFEGVRTLMAPWQTDIASDVAQRIAARAEQARYTPGQFRNRYTGLGDFRTGRFESGFEAPQDYTASRYRSQYEAPDEYQAQQFRNTYRAPGQEFGLAAAQQYMSPYMQSVVDAQQREAQRQADIATQARHAQAIRSGAYGGSRQAVMDAAAERNLALQKSDIQARGLQTAYEQAQAQFNADQARRQQEAAQAAQYGMAAQQATEASRQYGYGQDMTAAQLAAQYGLSAEQAREASRQFGYQQGLTADEIAARMAMSEQTAREQSRQYGYGQQMTEAQLRAQYGSEADRMREMSRQFGATFGQQGREAALGAATTLGNLGNLGYQQHTGLLGLQSQYGGQQYLRRQAIADTNYQNWVNEQQFPYKIIQAQSEILRGLPTSSLSTTYEKAQNPWVQGLGLGATVLGAGAKFYDAWNKPAAPVPSGAAGGQIKSRTAGLADIAMRKIAG